MLTEETPTTDHAKNAQPPKIHTAPPIFLHGVISYDRMINSINEVAETEQFYTKSMANNVIKISCLTPETYRTLIKHFKEINVYYHTYQLKEERAYSGTKISSPYHRDRRHHTRPALTWTRGQKYSKC
jgi:hypothetical protein